MSAEYHRIPSLQDYYINRSGKIKNKLGATLSPFKTKNGYMKINIKKKGYYVHRLVAETFIPNPNHKMQVNHIDMNRTNNRVSNLEWVSQSENIKHAITTKRKNGIAPKKYIVNEILEITTNKRFKNIIEASIFFNINNSTLSKSISENRKTKDGYRFIKL